MPLRYLSIFLAVTNGLLGALLIRAESPGAAQAITDSMSSPQSLILQASDGEHLLRRPKGQTLAAGAGSIPEFIIKVDKQNGRAEDFVVLTENLKHGAIIPIPQTP